MHTISFGSMKTTRVPPTVHDGRSGNVRQLQSNKEILWFFFWKYTLTQFAVTRYKHIYLIYYITGATAEYLFCQFKIIKNRLRNSISPNNLSNVVRYTIDVRKQRTHKHRLLTNNNWRRRSTREEEREVTGSPWRYFRHCRHIYLLLCYS